MYEMNLSFKVRQVKDLMEPKIHQDDVEHSNTLE